ncbi:MAG: carbohydrate kinase family protein [Lachnospiraceae bacterium]|nr:carbohydrate kinase family protein [Lachnospiraceae bacterium]
MKVLCIGSAVMDIMGYPIDQNAEWKEKQRISDIRILPGGDAVNQSITMAALGANPALVCCVGADMNGRMLKCALRDIGVDVSFVQEKEGHATGTAMVLVSENGERRVFSVKGAHSTLDMRDVPKVCNLPSDCRAISLASLFSMPEFEADGLEEYLKEAKEQGVLVFADLAADKLGLGLNGIRKFLPYIDYFLPSLYDVLTMTETTCAEDAAKAFHDLGVNNVVIKCGERGCYYSECGGMCGWAPAIPVEVVDTTGAGDCTVAAFVSRIIKGDSLDEACRFACAAGSYSTTFAGASTAELAEETVRGMLRMQEKEQI